MKTIGMIGGISWESTQEYYRLINNFTKDKLGGKHSARMVMFSFDWEEVEDLLNKEDFKKIGERLSEESLKLEQMGAECLMLGANTAHRWADVVKSNIHIPLIHIADATGNEIIKAGAKKVLLLGTRYTMEGDFISGNLKRDFGIEVVVPDANQIQQIHRIIFEELIVGKFLDTSRAYFKDLITTFTDIDGVILGCTELPLIIKPEDTTLPLFNTTLLHARAAVEFANE